MTDYYRDARDFLGITGAYHQSTGYGYDNLFSGWASSSGHGEPYATATHITDGDAESEANADTTQFNDSYVNSEGDPPANRIQGLASGNYYVWILIGGGPPGADADMVGVTVGAQSEVVVQNNSGARDTPTWKQAGAGVYSVDNTTVFKFRSLEAGYLSAIRAMCLKPEAGTPGLTRTGQEGDKKAGAIELSIADSFGLTESLAPLGMATVIAETFVLTGMVEDGRIFMQLDELVVLAGHVPVGMDSNAAEIMLFVDAPVWSWDMQAAESVAFPDSLSPMAFGTLLAEVCDFVEAIPVGVGDRLVQVFMIYDTPMSAWGATVLESFDLPETLTVLLGNFVQEVVLLSGSLAVRWEGVDTILDSLAVIDLPVVQKVFTDILLESFGNADESSSVHRKLVLVAELLILVGDLQVYGESSISLAEGIGIQDNVRAGWLKLVAESFAVAEPAIFNLILGLKALEVIRLEESVPTIGDFTETNAEILLLRDRVVGVWHKLIVETVDHPDSVVIHLALKVLEKILFTDTVPDIGKFTHQLAEAVAASDTTSFAWEKLLADTVLNTDTLAVMWFMIALVADTFASTDTADNLFRIQAVNAESLNLAESVVPQMTLYNLLADGVEFEITVIIDGEVWQCWVLNTKQFHPSVYSNFAFNSFAKFEGKSYGAKSDGVYLLEGSDDAGSTIRAGLQLTQSNFGSQNKKRIRAAYFGMSGSAPVLKVETEEGTAKYYQVTNRKAPIGRDVFGKDWTLTLTDFDDLEFIELIPVILTR